MESLEPVSVQADASELILCDNPSFICETYIFEPIAHEAALGRLFAVAETESRGDIGSELLDLTIQAVQREYYRDPSRGILGSFESALHQANLILHDSAEQGVRDWMGYFHVGIGVLAGPTLHISTAGNAAIVLARRSRLTTISQDLAHSPITNPLRTFAQVASGTLNARDTLFFGTSNFLELFRPEDLARFAIDHSAATISTRLQQLHADQTSHLPVAVLTVSILPAHIATPHRAAAPFGIPRRGARELSAQLSPRKPLIINRSLLRTLVVFLARLVSLAWHYLTGRIWPHVLRGSLAVIRLLGKVFRRTGKTVQLSTTRQLNRWQQKRTSRFSTSTASPTLSPSRSYATGRIITSPISWLHGVPSPWTWLHSTRTTFARLPRSSQIFAGITATLAVALVVSLLLLQNKRAEDAAIQRASELLHEAQTKKTAAETALIYDNRDQARTLLAEATTLNQELVGTGFYQSEGEQLRSEIGTMTDRLQKVVRASTATTRIVGDFGNVLGDKPPTDLAIVNDEVFSFDPSNNAILKLGSDGSPSIVTATTQGIGFFTTAATHTADKTIVLATDQPGIALFDAKSSSLQSQEIELPGDKPELLSLATYGTRLYIYDRATRAILNYNKTLRGYSGGTSWITAQPFPADSIRSIGVDGHIYTLHDDGTVRKLLKGEVVDFTVEPIEPSLAGASRLLKNEDLANIYILDGAHKRVVVLNDSGGLVRQIFLDIASQLSDIAIAPDEKTLYALDGTRVLAVSLEEE